MTGNTEAEIAAAEELARQEAALSDAIGIVTGDVSALAEAYTEAYTAALESIQGQYALWEKATPGLAIVGENGPELVAFSGGEKVLPAPVTAALLSGGGREVVSAQISSMALPRFP